MIIDHTYFVREINIPQLSQPAVLENLNLFIEKYEPQFLRAVFGWELAVLIMGYLNTEEVEGVEPDERIGWLVEGSPLKQWGGLRNNEKISPLANYIFYRLTDDSVTFLAQVGESTATAENSRRVSNDDRLIFVWNEMVEMMVGLHSLLKSGLYPEYKPEQAFKIKNTFNL
jgi:hypothetical protein